MRTMILMLLLFVDRILWDSLRNKWLLHVAMRCEYRYNNIRHNVGQTHSSILFFRLYTYYCCCLFTRNEWNLYCAMMSTKSETIEKEAIKRMHANIIRKLSCSLCFISSHFCCLVSLLFPLFFYFHPFTVALYNVKLFVWRKVL